MRLFVIERPVPFNNFLFLKISCLKWYRTNFIIRLSFFFVLRFPIRCDWPKSFGEVSISISSLTLLMINHIILIKGVFTFFFFYPMKFGEVSISISSLTILMINHITLMKCVFTFFFFYPMKFGEVSISISSLTILLINHIILINRVFTFSFIPWKRRQFLREYCACWRLLIPLFLNHHEELIPGHVNVWLFLLWASNRLQVHEIFLKQNWLFQRDLWVAFQL